MQRLKNLHLASRLISSKAAKTNWLYIIIAILAVVIVTGAVKMPNVDLAAWNPLAGLNGGASEGVSVTKKLQFSFVDKYSGAALASDTFYIYDGETHGLLESLTTDSDGIKATAKAYQSGRVLDVLYHQGNALVWYKITVPTMGASDAEASTYNNVDLEAFAIGTYTSDVLRTGSTSLEDNDVYNASDNTSPVFSYELTNSGSDNTGLMNSYDPIYDQNLRVCVVMTFSGTGYEHVIVNGADSTFTLGSTMYAVKYFDPQALTKWKVGGNYVPGYQGTNIQTFSLDLTGIIEADSVTWQTTAYAYADPDYAATHGGSVGNSEYTIAEQTITIDDGP